VAVAAVGVVMVVVVVVVGEGLGVQGHKRRIASSATVLVAPSKVELRESELCLTTSTAAAVLIPSR
jgi:hypothetical protein